MAMTSPVLLCQVMVLAVNPSGVEQLNSDLMPIRTVMFGGRRGSREK